MCYFSFDCLYLNGSSLLHEPLKKRRSALLFGLVAVEGGGDLDDGGLDGEFSQGELA